MMDFRYCWEQAGCREECQVREMKDLYCWKFFAMSGCAAAESCHECAYFLKWRTGEYTIEGFIHLHERRIAQRGKKKILVIDDEPTILFAFEETVRKKGHECISATSGREGLSKALKQLPDLIITDVVMPEIDGFELCSTLKNSEGTRHIPIIVGTAKTQQRDHTAGKLAGVDAFIEKPFKLGHLSKEIDRCLDYKRQEYQPA